MRLLSIFVFLLACSVAPGTQLGSPDAGIRAVIERYAAIRNHMDANALRQLLTPDADQLVSNGQWRKGRDALVQGAAASSKNENGHSSITVEQVRLLGADTAVADGRYETTSAGALTSRKMWTCFILKRFGGEWRIAGIRNMLPAP